MVREAELLTSGEENDELRLPISRDNTPDLRVLLADISHMAEISDFPSKVEVWSYEMPLLSHLPSESMSGSGVSSRSSW
jgi:hypothetical protein